MVKRIIAVVKALLFKNDGTVSVTKILALITAIMGMLVALPGVFATAGIPIPDFIAPWIKMATLLSGTLTVFRMKWDIEKAKGGSNE